MLSLFQDIALFIPVSTGLRIQTLHHKLNTNPLPPKTEFLEDDTKKLNVLENFIEIRSVK